MMKQDLLLLKPLYTAAFIVWLMVMLMIAAIRAFPFLMTRIFTVMIFKFKMVDSHITFYVVLMDFSPHDISSSVTVYLMYFGCSILDHPCNRNKESREREKENRSKELDKSQDFYYALPRIYSEFQKTIYLDECIYRLF